MTNGLLDYVVICCRTLIGRDPTTDQKFRRAFDYFLKKFAVPKMFEGGGRADLRACCPAPSRAAGGQASPTTAVYCSYRMV